MKRSLAYFILSLSVLVSVCGCGNHGRVIPRKTITLIYADMFLADQWLKDHPSSRKTSDTTLFYEPIFKKYGYCNKDYDESVRHYIKNPVRYAKILDDASELLDAKVKYLKDFKIKQAEVRKINAKIFGYEENDFDNDSIIWSQTIADTLLLKISKNAERRDSLRADTLKAPWQLPGLEPLAD